MLKKVHSWSIAYARTASGHSSVRATADDGYISALAKDTVREADLKSSEFSANESTTEIERRKDRR